MSKLNQINPLYGVEIGSTIDATTGKFSMTVVKEPINAMITQEESTKSMLGESSYVYSDQMNQGSFGLSGSYGISGVSKLKSSMSSYVGNSSAESSKSVAVNYNAFSLGGVEYIDLEQLNASELIASLSKGCQQSVMDVLDAYNKVVAAADELGVDLLVILESNDPKYADAKKLVSDWVNVSEKFRSNFGDGLVVGVAWGAFGGVNMLMTSEGSSDSWKYGGQADFSYAGIGKSVAVKATYDGSQSSSETNVKVNCTSFFSGSVLAPQIDEWFKQVSGKTFSELADVKVMDVAPDMKIKEGAPSIPDFEKPKPDGGITSKVGQIKDLKGLEAFAKASAYDEAKKKNPDLSLEDFLKKAEQPADTEALEGFREDVSENEIDTLVFDGLLLKTALDVESSSVERKAEKTDIKGYVPLGVWISNWADIFPWMAQGYYNSIDNIGNEEAVRQRVMLQDYQALSRLYYIAHSSGITEFKRKDPSLPRVSSLSIAEAFTNATGLMQANLGDTAKIKSIYDDLGATPKLIYDLWNEVSFLRDCELGMGLMKDGKSIGNPISGGDLDRQSYELISIGFSGKNYTAFSQNYKVLPLISPDRDISAFGPEQGGLSSTYTSEIVFTKPGRAKYLTFDYDENSKVLKNADHGITLYPIPYSAAKDINWKGMSLSTNIGSVTQFNDALKQLNEQLNRLDAWSFSSSNWDVNWNGEHAYIQKRIIKQYVGLIGEISNIL
jgi:hypothetical protein